MALESEALAFIKLTSHRSIVYEMAGHRASTLLIQVQKFLGNPTLNGLGIDTITRINLAWLLPKQTLLSLEVLSHLSHHTDVPSRRSRLRPIRTSH